MWIFFIVGLIFIIYQIGRRWKQIYEIIILPYIRPFIIRHISTIIILLAPFLNKASQNIVDIQYELLPGGKYARYYLREQDNEDKIFNVLVEYDSNGPELDKVLVYYADGKVTNILQGTGMKYNLSPNDILADKIEIWGTDLISGESELIDTATENITVQQLIEEM